jgi:hypothetical protein
MTIMGECKMHGTITDLGRPSFYGERMQQYQCGLTKQQHEFVKEFGGGNFPAGLRRLIDIAISEQMSKAV